MVQLLAGIAFSLAIAAFATQRKPEPMRVAGASLGLIHSPAGSGGRARLSGTINGLRVRVEILEGDPTQIHYCVSFPPLGVSLGLERRDARNPIARASNGADRGHLGESFEHVFRIETTNYDAVQTMLTADLRRRLLRLADEYPGFLLSDAEITLNADASDLTSTTVVNTVDAFVVLAVLLRVNRPRPADPQGPSGS